MNYDKYLPIGTVVLLKNATKRLMIVGFCVKGDTDDKIYDYVGCLYPEGLLSNDQNCLFNHSQIDKIFFLGFVSEEEKKFKKQLNSLIGSN